MRSVRGNIHGPTTRSLFITATLVYQTRGEEGTVRIWKLDVRSGLSPLCKTRTVVREDRFGP